MKPTILLLALLMVGCKPQPENVAHTITVIVHAPTNQTVAVKSMAGSWVAFGGYATNLTITNWIEKPEPWYFKGHDVFVLHVDKKDWYLTSYFLQQEKSKENLFRLIGNIFDKKEADAAGLMFGPRETFSLYGKGAGEWVLVRVKQGDNLFRVGKVQ